MTFVIFFFIFFFACQWKAQLLKDNADMAEADIMRRFAWQLKLPVEVCYPVLYCTILYCTVLCYYYTILYCTMLYYTRSHL